MPETVNNIADIENFQEQVQEAFSCTWNGLLDVMKSPNMEGFHRLRFEQLGRHPLENHPLTLQEQLTLTSHALATLAAAKRLLKDYPDCGGLKLNLTTTSGRDIKSCAKDEHGAALVEAEVFATVDTKYNSKLSGEIEKLRKESRAKYRYVFFYCPSGEHEPSEQCIQVAKDAKIMICGLTKAEAM